MREKEKNGLPSRTQFAQKNYSEWFPTDLSPPSIVVLQNSYKFSAEYKLKAKKKAEKAASDAKKDIVPADEAVPP